MNRITESELVTHYEISNQVLFLLWKQNAMCFTSLEQLVPISVKLFY